MVKKTRKDYDYYTMNIPNELRILFEAYIAKHPNLGFKSASQYLLHIIQVRAEEIIRENPDMKKIEEIRQMVISTALYNMMKEIETILGPKTMSGDEWDKRHGK